MEIVVACKQNVEAQYVEMMVPLYSYGCEKKVKKTLSNLKGIYSVKVDYNEQKVTVWGICNKYDVLATIKSKRKDARFWNPQDNTQVEQHTSPLPPKILKRSLTLIKPPSFSFKTLIKVFTRSSSF